MPPVPRSDAHAGAAPAALAARRRWLGAGVAMAATSMLPALAGCARQEALLRMASNIWPGYTLVHVAQEQGRFDPMRVRLIEMPAASDVTQALATGSIEAGALTLDEMLAARADGLDLVAVLVFDESRGGDALVARSKVRDLADLAGRRIGVEQSAVGALVLNAALLSAGLRLDQVEPVLLPVSEHYAAWREHRFDALVSFEPIISQVSALGARRLFDSRSMPGAILDVLAVRRSVLDQQPQGLRQLVRAHFDLLAQWRQKPERLLPTLASQLGLSIDETRQAYEGLNLPDLAANHDWLGGPDARLRQSAEALVEVMTQGNMLPRRPSLDGLTSALALPERT